MPNRIRTIFTLAVLALLLLPCLRAVAASDYTAARRTGIAAVVNDDVVTFSDIRNRLALYMSGTRGSPPPEARKKMETQVLDKLINEKLELQEAKNLGITVSDDDVSNGFADIAKQNHLPADEFKHRLAASGVKVSSLFDQIRAEVAWGQVVRRKLRPQVSVSEGEIDSAMDQMTRGKAKNAYLVAEILLKVPSARMDTTVRHDADKIVEQVTKGASFAQIARQFSQSPGAEQGGDLGWISEGQLDEKLEAALAKMHPGEVSPPIRTDNGYHILFLRDLHEAGAAQPPASAQKPAPQPTPVAAAKSEMVLHLKQITIPIAASDPAPIVSAKMNRAQSLKQEISGCAQMDQKAKDFNAGGTGDLGSGPASGLPAPVRKAVEHLPIGELSDPIRGDNGVAVVMVCERSGGSEAPAETAAAPAPAAPAQPATLSKDDDKSRDQVANQIGSLRLDQLQERYLRDLRASAYIDKRI